LPRRAAKQAPYRLGGIRTRAGRSCRAYITLTTTIPSKSCWAYIDWMPFFNAWEFAGKFPDISHRPPRSAKRRAIFTPIARRMLKQLIAERWPRSARSGGPVPGKRCWRRRRDLCGYFPQKTREPRCAFPAPSRKARRPGLPHECLADYVAPKSSGKTGLHRRICRHVGHWHRTAHRALRKSPMTITQASC